MATADSTPASGFDFAELARRTARASQVGRDLDLVQEIVTEMRDVRVPEDRCDEDEYLADLAMTALAVIRRHDRGRS